jgi:large subunit ribosomal protein L18
MAVKLSNRAITVQIVNDVTGETLVSSSSINLKATGSLSEKAAVVGKDVATKAKKAKITKVAFDRNGKSYQKRLAALADAARENGLEF